MQTRIFIILLAIKISCMSCLQVVAQTKMVNSQSLQQTQSVFVENKGQVVDEKGNPSRDILFTLHSGSTTVFISASSIHYQFEKLDFPEGYELSSRTPGNFEAQEALQKQIRRSTHRMTLSLKGANRSGQIV